MNKVWGYLIAWGMLVLPLLFGIFMLFLAKNAKRLKPWKNWHRPGDEVSYESWGVLGVVFPITLVMSALPVSLFIFIACAFLIATFFLILKRRKQYGFIPWWKYDPHVTAWITKAFIIITILLIAFWLPWKLYETDIQWSLPRLSWLYPIGLLVLLGMLCWKVLMWILNTTILRLITVRHPELENEAQDETESGNGSVSVGRG